MRERENVAVVPTLKKKKKTAERSMRSLPFRYFLVIRDKEK